MTETQTLAGLNQAQFSSHIDELNLLLLEFRTLLETESQQLKQSDAEALVESSQLKGELSEKIEQLVNTLNLELGNSSDTLNFIDLGKQKAFQTLSQELQTKVDQSIELSQRCHDLNIANGMSIQILSNINQVSLQILTGQNESNSDVYGSSGETSTPKKGSTLGKA